MSKCKKCNEEVIWRERPGGGFFPPENKDGSRHDCEKKAAPQQPKEDARIGIYGGITKGRINLTLRSGIMVSEATPDLLKCLTDPNTAVKNGMKVKLLFAKDGKAEKAEVCPDQPAPTAEPPAPEEMPKETCTSPQAESPAAELSDEDRVRAAIMCLNPSDRVGSRISLAGMVNSVIEMERISKDRPEDYADIESEVKRKAVAMFLWCDSLTTRTVQ